MSLAVFGPGSLYITRIDVPNQTPVNIGSAESFSYDEAAENKDLHGSDKYALDSRTGTIKATGKIKTATISGIALNSVFHGGTFVAGGFAMSEREPITVPSAAPYTATVANAATYDTDLGLIYGATALPLMFVTEAPETGQYSVDTSTGEYTFAVGDKGVSILGTYAYKTTDGQTLTVTNTPIGSNPKFQLDYASNNDGLYYYVRMFRCSASKLTRAHKQTDFVSPEIDFSFFAAPNGNVYSVSYPEVS